MIIFINSNSTIFCQITLYIKTFIHKKWFIFFCLTVELIRVIFLDEQQLERFSNSK